MRFAPIYNIDDSINQTNYYSFDNGFSEQELIWIDNLKELYPFQTATTVSDESNPNEEIRKSNIKWIYHDEKSAWVYDRIRDLSIEANNSIWKFNLHSILDSIQYTEYYANGGHYGWHTDIGPGSISHRKISITIQLSSPDEYEGGDFELWHGGEFRTMEKKKGSAILFPSFTLHRVTPITKGVRRSLVLWVGGEAYK
jgi:PKHD-type hydroxylase